jgi:hypothetical protein
MNSWKEKFMELRTCIGISVKDNEIGTYIYAFPICTCLHNQSSLLIFFTRCFAKKIINYFFYYRSGFWKTEIIIWHPSVELEKILRLSNGYKVWFFFKKKIAIIECALKQLEMVIIVLMFITKLVKAWTIPICYGVKKLQNW